MTRTAYISQLSGISKVLVERLQTLRVFGLNDTAEVAAEKLVAHRQTRHQPMSKPITPETARRIIQYHRDGYGYAALTRLTGYSENACRAVIKGRPQARKREYESSYQRYKDQTEHNDRAWEEKRAECERLIRAGLTPAQIACELGVSQKRIATLRKDLGLGGRVRENAKRASAKVRRDAKAAEALRKTTVMDCPK